jgi:hypothetical protein
MLKQLLASASTIALLLASSSYAGATALAASDRATPPPASGSKTATNSKPASDRFARPSSIKACKSIPIPRPSVGGTRERIEAIRKCNKARSQEQQMLTNPSTTKPNLSPQVPSPMR